MEPAARPQASFKDAMRCLASTVGIISTGSGDIRHGMTATAITSLSMDPPSLLVCVNRSGSFHALISQSSEFCVNLLQSEQSFVSDAFAGKLSPEERFRYGDWDEDELGVPYLKDAQASIFCVKQDAIDHGSHSIFIGVVRAVKLAEDVRPLLYSNGVYSRCAPLAASMSV